MKYYATVKHHSTSGYWTELIGATTLTGAKRMATKRYGNGYHDHVIHVVECPDGNDHAIGIGLLNDLPAHRRIIGPMFQGWT